MYLSLLVDKSVGSCMAKKKKKKKQASGGKLVNANKKLWAIVEQRHRGKEFPGSLLASLFIARKFVAHTHLKQHGHFLGNFLFQEMLLKTPYTYKRPYLYNNYTILLVYDKCTVRNAFFLDICLFSSVTTRVTRLHYLQCL